MSNLKVHYKLRCPKSNRATLDTTPTSKRSHNNARSHNDGDKRADAMRARTKSELTTDSAPGTNKEALAK